MNEIESLKEKILSTIINADKKDFPEIEKCLMEGLATISDPWKTRELKAGLENVICCTRNLVDGANFY